LICGSLTLSILSAAHHLEQGTKTLIACGLLAAAHAPFASARRHPATDNLMAVGPPAPETRRYLMRRKTFDALLTTGGLVIAIVLAVAGGLLAWGHSFADSNVHSQLAAQQIFFPTKADFAAAKTGTEVTPGMIPYLEKYAGKQLTTGAEADAYAQHYIAVHLSQMPYGGVYANVSAASRANPTNATLAAEVETSFKGTTLRGLLLEAYGYGKMGQIAGIASIVSFIGAGLMLLLAGLGVVRTRKADPDAELMSWLHTQPEVPVRS
jgi:hypothetical protein